MVRAKLEKMRFCLRDFESSLRKALKEPGEVLEKYCPISIKK